MSLTVRVAPNGAMDYAKYNWRNCHHHARFKHRVESAQRKLMCQECGGGGEYVEEYIDGYARYEHCGWCEGTGLVTPWLRGQWLKWRRTTKAPPV